MDIKEATQFFTGSGRKVEMERMPKGHNGKELLKWSMLVEEGMYLFIFDENDVEQSHLVHYLPHDNVKTGWKVLKTQQELLNHNQSR